MVCRSFVRRRTTAALFPRKALRAGEVAVGGGNNFLRERGIFEQFGGVGAIHLY